MAARKIGGPFGRSVFGPIHEHLVKVMECLELLVPMAEAFVQGDQPEVQRRAAEIHEREHAADQIKNEIRRRLSASIFSSIERSEVLLLLKTQDSVSDNCEEVAKLLEIRRTPVPEPLHQLLLDYAAQIYRTGECLAVATEKLQEVGSPSASEDLAQDIDGRLDEVGRQEHQANLAEQAFLKRLFEEEKSLDPVGVIFLMEISNQLAAIGDEAENTADGLRRLVGLH